MTLGLTGGSSLPLHFGGPWVVLETVPLPAPVSQSLYSPAVSAGMVCFAVT